MKFKNLFNKGDTIWTIVDLKLKHGIVEEVCREGDDILYRVDREIYTLSVHPHPYIIKAENAYTEETALAKLVEQYGKAFDDALEHMITLSNARREVYIRLRKLRGEKANEE